MTLGDQDDNRPLLDKWQAAAAIEVNGANLAWFTSDGIELQPLYTSDDVTGIDPGLPGCFPFTRGVKASMYAGKPWTIRQYAGFSTAEESNVFYRKNLDSGQQGLSVAFDLATQRGYDSDHPDVESDVGMAGVAIDSVEDMKVLFNSIPLDEISVSLTMNGAVLPCLAFYLVAAEEQGVRPDKLKGTIQNDILKEFAVRNTYIYAPGPSMRIVADIIAFTAQNMPRFNSISVSGYHMQEAGATQIQELAFTLADGMEYVRAAMARGLSVDAFAGRLSFFFGVGMNFFAEVAKLRAARALWARIMKDYGAVEPRSMMLRTHCQTSGASLAESDPFNNIVRTTVEALAAVLGGTQSLHTNAFDEAIALPTELSARIARNTQLLLQEETDITKVIDPLGGSYYVESLTKKFEETAWALIQEIEAMGGMTKAIELGIPKDRIEQAAALRQARFDSGMDVIVGVNKFRPARADLIKVQKIDNAAVRLRQIERIEKLKACRDSAVATAALDALRKGAHGADNLMDLCVDCARARCTLGEISKAMEDVFGRHREDTRFVSGLYGSFFQNDENASLVRDGVESMRRRTGRKPRILVAKMGQDGHDRGAKIIASALADLGFEVFMTPLFQKPREVAALAIKHDVHVVGASSLAAGHRILLPELIALLSAAGRADIRVVAGGIIPQQDLAFLRSAGVEAIFGPGTNIIEAAADLLRLLGHNQPSGD